MQTEMFRQGESRHFNRQLSVYNEKHMPDYNTPNKSSNATTIIPDEMNIPSMDAPPTAGCSDFGLERSFFLAKRIRSLTH